MDKFWMKQTTDKPLFPDLLWSRPENKLHAGKLLIIGGNLHGFAAAAEAYTQASKAGIGVAKVLLPDVLKKTVGRILENGEYASSTPSGSFSQQALAEWLEQAAWADGVLIAGDLGHNSETSILLEKFLDQYDGRVTLAKDAVDYVTSNPIMCDERNKTTLVLSFTQLQKLLTALKYPRHIESTMGLPNLAELLNDFSQTHKFYIVTKHSLDLREVVRSEGELTRAKTVLSEGEVSVDTSREEKPFVAELLKPGDERALHKSSVDHIVVAVDGQVSTTPVVSSVGATTGQAKLEQDIKVWCVSTAAYAAVWWLQNPSKPFEALSNAIYSLMERSSG